MGKEHLAYETLPVAEHTCLEEVATLPYFGMEIQGFPQDTWEKRIKRHVVAMTLVRVLLWGRCQCSTPTATVVTAVLTAVVTVALPWLWRRLWLHANSAEIFRNCLAWKRQKEVVVDDCAIGLKKEPLKALPDLDPDYEESEISQRTREVEAQDDEKHEDLEDDQEQPEPGPLVDGPGR
ncbi:hypothetical protein AUP68_00023 [Ilyonectria robusta]